MTVEMHCNDYEETDCDDFNDDDVKTDPIVSYHKPKLERPKTSGERDSPMLKILFHLQFIICHLSFFMIMVIGDY